jgi:hypothetical protein
MAGKKKGNGQRKIRGKGDYEVSRPATAPTQGILGKLDKVLSRLPKGSFAAGGAAIGARVGGARGAGIGRDIGAGLSAISGYGNYKVAANSLARVSSSVDMVPQFVKNEHSVRVTHREFIGDLVAPALPGTFTNTEYAINPGNSSLFPWGSQMAKQYSQYKIHGMVMVYKAMTSDYAAAGPLGTVIMATNYNALDKKFITKVEMENSEFACSTKPSLSLVHAIECDTSVSGIKTLYIRDPANESTDTSDRRFYDFGKFQVATTGLPAQVVPGTTMGELWISYDIEFMKPVIGGQLFVSEGLTVTGQTSGASVVGVGGNTSGVIPFVTFSTAQPGPSTNVLDTILPGTTGLVTGGYVNLVTTVVSRSSSTLTLRKNGRYIIVARMFGDTTPTNNSLASTTYTEALSTLSNTGTATSFLNTDIGRVAPVCAATNTLNGYDSVQYYEVAVNGIPDGTGTTNFVTWTPATYTTAPSAMILNITKTVAVYWHQVGVNGQATSFNPVVY